MFRRTAFLVCAFVSVANLNLSLAEDVPLYAATSIQEKQAEYRIYTPQEPYDPLEKMNRVIFNINMGLDVIFIKPISQAYSTFIPQPMRHGIGNVVRNAATPLTFIHDVVQLKAERATHTFFRFLINSTIGIAGLFDVAARVGLPHHKQDMGQTLAHYGMQGGPYLVLPILGSSNFRDTIGLASDSFIDPVRLVMLNNGLDREFYTQVGVSAVDQRAQALDLTDELNKRPDPYKQYRTLYLQNRAYHIRGQEVDTSDLPGAE